MMLVGKRQYPVVDVQRKGDELLLEIEVGKRVVTFRCAWQTAYRIRERAGDWIDRIMRSREEQEAQERRCRR